MTNLYGGFQVFNLGDKAFMIRLNTTSPGTEVSVVVRSLVYYWEGTRPHGPYFCCHSFGFDLLLHLGVIGII